MKTIYAACLSRLGLSQAEAAALHGVSLESVKSWAQGRRSIPEGIWNELRGREMAVVDGSEELRERWEAAGSPPIEMDDSEAGGPVLIALADFVLSSDAPVHVGRTKATETARQARRPN